MGHAGVGWGVSCRDGVGHVGVSGVGLVMQRWGGSCRGVVDLAGMGWHGSKWGKWGK